MPLSQGDTAICFAYATADMISQRVGTEISALDVATKYYFADPSRLAQSTNPDLQRHLLRMGHYRAAIAESRAATDVSTENNPGRYPYIDMLEGGEEDIAALLYNVEGLCKDQDLPSYDGFTHFAALSLLRTLMQILPPAQYSIISLAGTVPALRSPKTDAFNAAWIKRVDRQCRRRPLPVPLLPINYRVATNEASFMQLLEEGRPPSDSQVDRMFSMIDYALDHNRAPASGYSWYVLEKRDPDDPDLVADHSSVIIGRRRSALDAVGVARKRCWRYDWVLDLDIKAFFDSIDPELQMRAVRKHTDCPWVLLYIDRWLKAPVQIARKQCRCGL